MVWIYHHLLHYSRGGVATMVHVDAVTVAAVTAVSAAAEQFDVKQHMDVLRAAATTATSLPMHWPET